MSKRLPHERWSQSMLNNLLENQRAHHRKSREPRPVKQDVKNLLKSLKLLSKSKRKRISSLWQQVAREISPAIIDSTEVLSFRNGVLKIAVASSALLFELEHFHKNRIIAKLQSDSQHPIIKLVFELQRHA